MNARLRPQALKRHLVDFFPTDQHLADLLVVLQRGLNTWEDAPEWMLSLSDEIEVGNVIAGGNEELVTIPRASLKTTVGVMELLASDRNTRPAAPLNGDHVSQTPADTVPRADFNALKMQEHALSAAYVRLREIIGAMSPPEISPPEALWSYVEGVARSLVSNQAKGLTVWKPALYVSPGQLQGLHDGSLPGFKDLPPESGGYMPVRTTPGGNFTQPLYAGQQQDQKAGPREVIDALQACLNTCNRIIDQDKGVLGGIDFHALKVGVLRGLAHAQSEAVPAILFDGYAVLQALDEKAQARTSPENVSDVLDAVVREMRSGKSEPVRALSSSMLGWSISASDDPDGCTWLKLQHPSGAQASVSVRTNTGNGDRTIVAQILADLHTDFNAAKAKVGAA